MGSLSNPQMTAGGDIYPCRLVKLSTSADFKVLQATAGDRPIGISQEGTRYAPGTPADTGIAAAAGDTPRVFGLGEICLLELGTGGAVRNDLLKSDANGKGVTASAGDEVGAIALESGAAGEKIKVQVISRNFRGFTTVRQIVSIPLDLASITGSQDVLTSFTPGFSGKIIKLDAVVNVPVTTAAKAVNLNAEIGSTNLTGGVIGLTSANCATMGAVVAGSSVTAGNTFTANDTISLEASGVTAFVEGTVTILMVIEADLAA
jgi:hypothetical protein